MAQVASERLDQMQDPEKSIDQAIVDYSSRGDSPLVRRYLLSVNNKNKKNANFVVYKQ
jgi:hypothetical protein